MDAKWGYMSSAHVLGDFDGYHRLLCALSYKHNNQHRRSPWWMALQTFKRQLLDLIRDMQDLQRLLDQTTTKRRNSIHEGQTTRLHTTKLEREKVWKEWFIEHWAIAFSQLTASNQWAELGTVLLATLSSTCHRMGLLDVYDDALEKEGSWHDDDQAEQEEDMGTLIERAWAEEELGSPVKRVIDTVMEHDEEEDLIDLGEPVARVPSSSPQLRIGSAIRRAHSGSPRASYLNAPRSTGSLRSESPSLWLGSM